MTEPLWHLIGDPLFGGAFRNLWPLLVMPALAALISDRSARLLPKTPEAWAPAALLAALPGLVALGAMIPLFYAGGEVMTWRGVVLFELTPAVAVLMVGYALVRGLLRQREVNRLFRAGVAPGERLRAAAERLGLNALELNTDDKECFVAGVFQPTVFLSRGALAGLSDQELEAALHHERAHVRGRDTQMLFTLAILRDLAPYARPTALEAFQSAREATADRAAAAHAGPLNLASALVALARQGSPKAAIADDFRAALPMAKHDTLRWRMQAILETGEAEAGKGSWSRVAGGVVANAALVAWPAAQIGLLWIVCTN
jgi:Zn-dependent protease with chaperone function